jgi:hypothetical protein
MLSSVVEDSKTALGYHVQLLSVLFVFLLLLPGANNSVLLLF